VVNLKPFMHVLQSTVLTSIYVSNIFRFYFVLICCFKFSLFTMPLVNQGLKLFLLNVLFIYLTMGKNILFIGACLFLARRRNCQSSPSLFILRLRMLAWYLTCSSALHISPTLRLGVLET
jgi:hypothetical protein